MTEGLDTAVYVGSLNAAEPTGQRKKSTLDNHARTIKETLLNSFAGFVGQIIVGGTEAQGSTVNDYVVTISADTAPTTMHNRMLIVAKATHTNTSACTLAINNGSTTLTAVNLKSSRGEALGAGAIVETDIFIAIYDSGSGEARLVSGNDCVSRAGANTLTGTYDASAATITMPSSQALPGNPTTTTQTAGDNSTRIATTAFVAGLGMSAILPGQTNKDGLVVTSISSSANWYEGVDQSRMALGII